MTIVEPSELSPEAFALAEMRMLRAVKAALLSHSLEPFLPAVQELVQFSQLPEAVAVAARIQRFIHVWPSSAGDENGLSSSPEYRPSVFIQTPLSLRHQIAQQVGGPFDGAYIPIAPDADDDTLHTFSRDLTDAVVVVLERIFFGDLGLPRTGETTEEGNDK